MCVVCCGVNLRIGVFMHVSCHHFIFVLCISCVVCGCWCVCLFVHMCEFDCASVSRCVYACMYVFVCCE